MRRLTARSIGIVVLVVGAAVAACGAPQGAYGPSALDPPRLNEDGRGDISIDARDLDRDGIIDGADHCIATPEDHDGVDDDDGCPEDDSGRKDFDGDGIADDADLCPGEQETRNGYQDGDGCPDVAPAPAPARP
ncbi:MAG: hypothetical protein H6709_07570 [Kofleriaceae bacterium]|nr:hypothetical protein [Kofleriaceae bacterium]MCB9571937.1 hypothetical protein [Kofleriaceae bacterium]